MTVVARSIVAGCAVLLAACAGGSVVPSDSDPAAPQTTAAMQQPTTTTTQVHATPGTARLLFAGDVMVGRRVAPVAAAEGVDLFRGVRVVIGDADVAAANLESPLTTRPHLSENPNELEADPALAALLAAGGFDLMSLANNHAGDAGAGGVADTIDALVAAGMAPLGAGDGNSSGTAHVVERAGLRVAFLAFDATGLGLGATATSPGVAVYDPASARDAVEAAAAVADVVAVSVHGGLEYLLSADPILEDIADALVDWGADIVWGHGGHVPQPVTVVGDPGESIAVVATGLGNFLFDQQRELTQTGLLLEVLVSAEGVIAYRTGRVDHGDLRPDFIGWDLPAGDAVYLAGSWWTLAERPAVGPPPPTVIDRFPLGDVTTAARGDATGDGTDDLVVSYRREFRPNPVNALYPEHDFTDADGRSAHLGVFEPGALRPVWAAGTLLRPVAQIAVCDGSLALAFDGLDDAAVVATGAWTWWDFGFAIAAELPGSGVATCVDVDEDGRLDPVIDRRDHGSDRS